MSESTDWKPRTLEVGPIGTCCYIVAEEGESRCAVIDPGDEPGRIRDALEAAALAPSCILLTHGHYDHIGGVGALLEAYPDAELLCHPRCATQATRPRENLSALLGAPCATPEPTRLLEDGEAIRVGSLTLEAHHLPGHAPGHMVYHLPQKTALFCGDTIFAGGIGRSDLPGGDGALLLEGLLALLRRLPEETRLYPGHGPATTVRNERKNNPHIQSHF